MPSLSSTVIKHLLLVNALTWSTYTHCIICPKAIRAKVPEVTNISTSIQIARRGNSKQPSIFTLSTSVKTNQEPASLLPYITSLFPLPIHPPCTLTLSTLPTHPLNILVSMDTLLLPSTPTALPTQPLVPLPSLPRLPPHNLDGHWTGTVQKYRPVFGQRE